MCTSTLTNSTHTHTHIYTYIYIYIYIYKECISIDMCRLFVNTSADRDSTPSRVIPKTPKMVLDISLLNTQHYISLTKGRVKWGNSGKVVALSPKPVVAIEKEAFVPPLATVANIIIIEALCPVQDVTYAHCFSFYYWFEWSVFILRKHFFVPWLKSPVLPSIYIKLGGTVFT